MSPLSSAELQRYMRHLLLPEVGLAGQEKIRAARVLCVGVGGLGSPLALYLAAAGVGTLGLVDDDRVDETNLQRQVLHGEADVGRAKVDSARDTLAAINGATEIVPHAERLTAANALDLFADYDVVADGTDNFPTRYLVNDACVLTRTPNAYGSVFRFEGQASVFAHDGGPCYRCLYPEPPPPGLVPNCAEGGVLGVLPGLIGMIQATEVLKLILGVGETLAGRLLLYDSLEMRFREMRVRRDPKCPVCGDDPTIRTLRDDAAGCETGADSADSAAPPSPSPLESVDPAHDPGRSSDSGRGAPDDIEPTRLKRWMDSGKDVLVLDVRNPDEYRFCRIEGSLLLPLHSLAQAAERLDRSRPTVVVCHVGIRSALAGRILIHLGFERILNLRGGIEAWSTEVDPSVPRY